jgi:hypothetical protein
MGADGRFGLCRCSLDGTRHCYRVLWQHHEGLQRPGWCQRLRGANGRRGSTVLSDTRLENCVERPESEGRIGCLSMWNVQLQRLCRHLAGGEPGCPGCGRAQIVHRGLEGRHLCADTVSG